MNAKEFFCKSAFSALLMAAALTLPAGCRSCPQCPEVAARDSVAAVDVEKSLHVGWRVDSVSTRDSIVTYISGDTVRMHEYHFREKVKLHTDTATRDRVIRRLLTRTVTVTKSVPAPRPRWLTALAACGAGAILLLILYIYRKFKKSLTH